MIEIFYESTPNGHKITLFAEEAELDYRIHAVGTTCGNQFHSQFLEMSPNGKIPVIVDHAPADGGAPVCIFESGAILIYLAEKTGRFLPQTPRAKAETLQWLMWQMSSLGPMSGQRSHFRRHAPADCSPYPLERYTREVERLYAVMDHRLADRPFLAGGELTIADMACHPWARRHPAIRIDFSSYPHLERWSDTIEDRPAATRAYALANTYPMATSNPPTEVASLVFANTSANMRRAYDGAFDALLAPPRVQVPVSEGE